MLQQAAAGWPYVGVSITCQTHLMSKGVRKYMLESTIMLANIYTFTEMCVRILDYL